MNPSIFLNWKMNSSLKEIDCFFTALGQTDLSKIVLFPPFSYIKTITDRYQVTVGAQNVCTEHKGAYTGEISAYMLSDIGCKYVLVGHSERRNLYGESIQDISKKVDVSLSEELVPVLCVGERLEDRKANKCLDVIKKQMESFKDGCVIAYEPVWSIGSGLIPTSEEVLEVSQYLKQYTTDVLYGGSVTSANIKEIIADFGVSGVLVGGASLKADEVTTFII